MAGDGLANCMHCKLRYEAYVPYFIDEKFIPIHIHGYQWQIMRHGVGVTSLISFWGICDHKKIMFHVKDVMQKYE